MPVSKKREHKRKNEKIYTFVEFSTEIFEEPFRLPDQKHFNVGLITDVQDGKLDSLLKWLQDAGTDEADIEAIRELEQNEIQDFMSAWSEGSSVSLPK